MILRMIVKELVRSSLGMVDETSVLVISDLIKSAFYMVFAPLKAISVLLSILMMYRTRSSNSFAIYCFFVESVRQAYMNTLSF